MSIAYTSYRTINYSPWRLSKLAVGATLRPLWTLNSSNGTTTMPTVSSTQVKWGTTSAFFNGTSNTMSFTAGVGSGLPNALTSVATGGLIPTGGTSAWTFEMWIYIQGIGTQRGYFDAGPGGVAFGIQAGGKLYLGLSNVTFGVVGNTFLANGNWYHVCAMTSGGTNYLFVNGGLDGSGSSHNYGGTNPWTGNQMPSMGVGPGASPLSGYVQDIRISNGAIYPTTGFTAPTAPLQNLASTRLLIPCYNNAIADNSSV